MEDAAAKRMLTLRSSDGELFVVEEEVVRESKTIEQIFIDDCITTTVPVPNVTSKVLALVMEYCTRHVQARAEATQEAQDALEAFEEEFVQVDQSTLFDLILAANYLNVKGLLDLTCQAVANIIKGKSPTEIRATFNIVNDFTPEEEEEVMRENTWVHE